MGRVIPELAGLLPLKYLYSGWPNHLKHQLGAHVKDVAYQWSRNCKAQQ
jgi:hypothetical protein